MKPRGHALAAALALGAALTVAGCGQDSSPRATAPSAPTSSAAMTTSTSPSPSASPVPDGPRCATVWVAGRRLPAGYRGCVRGGVWVMAHSRPCEFGRDLTTYADQFYAVTGGKVMHPGKPLLEQKKYRLVLRLCSG